MRILNIAKTIVRRKTDGKYLVLTGSVWNERPDRSQKPDLPGGVVEAGEETREGCVREIFEETGMKVEIGQLVLVHASTHKGSEDDASINRLMYFVDLEDDPEITLSWEHEAYEWLTREQLHELDIRDPYPELFRYLEDIEILI